MRCSICDKEESRWIYNNYHCSECEEAIAQTIGVTYDEEPEKGEVITIDSEADSWLLGD